MGKAKPFSISKHVVLKAFKKVKANKGAAGVDGESIAEFEKDLKNNLYKLWNRMSSGSYFPPPVRSVEIPRGPPAKSRTSSSEARRPTARRRTARRPMVAPF